MDAFVAGMPETVQTIDYDRLYRSVYNTSEGLRVDLETDWKGSRKREVKRGQFLLDEAIIDMAPNHAERYPAFERLANHYGGAEFCRNGVLVTPLRQFIESEIFAHSVSARDPRKHGDEPGWYHLLDTRERFLRCSEHLVSDGLRTRGAIVLPLHDCYEDFEVTAQELTNAFRSSIPIFGTFISNSVELMSTPKPEKLIYWFPHITKKHAPHIADELTNPEFDSVEAMKELKAQNLLVYEALKRELKSTFKPWRMRHRFSAIETGGKMADGISVLAEWQRNIWKGDIQLNPAMPLGTKGEKIDGQPTAVSWDLIMINVEDRIDYHNTGLRHLADHQIHRAIVSSDDFVGFGRNLTQELVIETAPIINFLSQALPSNDNYKEMRARVSVATAKLEQLKAA